MFTLEQIKMAHSKVKSGADFPAYIKEIKELGVSYYETFVTDGHTDYFGEKDYKIASDATFGVQRISDMVNNDTFQFELKAHQQGKTDYPTFIAMCATCGIEKWSVNMDKMTCAYYDTAGNELLTEKIPS